MYTIRSYKDNKVLNSKVFKTFEHLVDYWNSLNLSSDEYYDCEECK